MLLTWTNSVLIYHKKFRAPYNFDPKIHEFAHIIVITWSLIYLQHKQRAKKH